MKLLEITKSDSKKRQRDRQGCREQEEFQSLTLVAPFTNQDNGRAGKNATSVPMAWLDSGSAEFCTQVTNRMVSLARVFLGTPDFAATKNKDCQPEHKKVICKCHPRHLHEVTALLSALLLIRKKLQAICRDRKN